MIYVLELLSTNYIKIGKAETSVNLNQRLSSHFREFGPFQLLVVVPVVSYAVETLIKQHYVSDLVPGETEIFYPTARFRHFIDNLIRDHDSPDESVVASWSIPLPAGTVGYGPSPEILRILS